MKERCKHKWEVGYGFTPSGRHFGGHLYCVKCYHCIPLPEYNDSK